MAYEIPSFYLGVLQANQDMSTESTWQYTPVNAVAASGAGLSGTAVDAPSASGDPVIGILQNNPLLGEAAAVMVHGVTKALALGTISIGQLLMAVPQKGLVVATSGNYAVAQALEAAVAGDIFTVLLIRNGKI